MIMPVFETNDDVGSLLIANGFFSGRPEMGLVFSNPWLGELIRALYEAFGSIPWYSVYLYLLLTAAAILHTGAVLRLRPRRTQAAGFLILLLAFLFPVYLEMQFTRVAILLGAAACMGYFADVHLRDASLPRCFAWGALLGLSGVVRSEAPLACLALLLPGMLLLWSRLGPRTIAAFLGGVLAGVLLDQGSRWLYLRLHEDWFRYQEYNALRGQFHNTFRLDYRNSTLSEAIERAGWTKLDLLVFREWLFTGEDRFGADKLRILLEHSSRLAMTARQLSFEMGLVLKEFASRFLLLLFVVLPGLRLIDRELRARIGFLLVWIFAVFMLMKLYARLPSRVADPLFFLSGNLILFTILEHAREAGSSKVGPFFQRLILRTSDGIAAVLMISALAFHLHEKVTDNLRVVSEIRKDRELIAELQTLPADTLLVVAGASWVLSSLHPFEEAENWKQFRGRMLGLGWVIHSPPYAALLQKYGIRDLLWSMITDRRVALSIRPAYVPLLEEYVFERYGVRVKGRPFAQGPFVEGSHAGTLHRFDIVP